MFNIVIVEDEPIELESLRRIISQCVENAVIHEASTGKKAIQLIDQFNHIDMIFVDINIPLPNGNQVIEYLRKKSADTKVIVTTANDDFDIVRSMYNLKVNDYLLKPVKKSILIDTIKKTLEVNEDDNEKSRALKQKVFTLIDECRYAPWHSLLFDMINGACHIDGHNEEQRKEVIDFLEIVSQYTTVQGEKLAPTHRKVTAMIKDINQYGIIENRYFRVIFGLLTISEELFDYAFKNYSGNIDFIERAKFHIEKNILRNLTLDDVAAKSFVSPCYLSRAFKKITGIGFSNYIATRKITIAKSLLQFSDMKVNTIALELAYQDSNYFCRIFKKETGLAPSDYRKIVTPAESAALA
ncbi:AraC family transcriptional regulator [Enterobacteriaceae bacterium H4N4]|uniref:AraC family transcriptional regulator n=1 Tax=Silvania confinis TaxID=2926470 RepID=A0A9J6QJW8_9ENTR|nr:AraC family transcriptional regulator [Silvania confinis]MCU6669638.1 AraC family transcriptional regulator [Silvania confinis]